MKSELKIILVVALLGLFSCCKEEGIDSPDKQNGTPIYFDQISTRATLSDVQANGFHVWANLRNSLGKSASILENEAVTYNNPNWTYTKTAYWLDDWQYYFLASYSQTAQFTTYTETQDDVDYTIYYLDVTTDGTAVNDILTAYNYTDTNSLEFNPEDAVSFTFGHLLTKVNLKIQQDTDKDPNNDYYVTKVTLSGVKNNGTYFVFPFDGEFQRGWEMKNTTTEFIQDYSGNPVCLRAQTPGNTKILTVWDDGLLLIPQPIALNDVQIRIDYKYHLNGTEFAEAKERYVTASLPVSNDLWQSGKVITYSLKLAEPNDISFGIPTIEPWGAPQTGGTIIIK